MINQYIPAFPSEQGHAHDGTWNQTYDPGMSLRDYFAAKAMQGYLAAGNTIADDELARWSYLSADAMLTERAK